MVTQLVLELSMTHLDLERSNITSNIKYVKVHLFNCGCAFTYVVLYDLIINQRRILILY